MSWLSDLVYQHRELESPVSFWYWSAIAAISATVRDNVWIDRAGVYNLYPNIYVLLHAESGLKKGPPVSMANRLVKAVNNTKIIRGRGSIQGILKEMGTQYSQPGGKVNKKSIVFICSSELSSSIVEDKVATKILTDLYDRNYNEGEWRSLLKMEQFTLHDPTITMLTATNEAMSDDFFTRSAIQGGYFARTFIIYEKESAVTNSLIFPLSNPPNYTSSSDYLKEIAKLSGPFRPLGQEEQNDIFRYKKFKFGREIWFCEAGILYDDWYEEFKKLAKDQDVKDETGTLNRFGDSVLKVAMLLSLAREPVLTISTEAMHEAISECEKLLGNVRRTTMGRSGSSTSAGIKTLILEELLRREPHQITRAMLMKKMWMHYSGPEEFDEIMQSFDGAGVIKTSAYGNQILYTMPETQVQEMIRFLAGKNK